MSEVAIQVSDIGKRYRIGAAQEQVKTLREALTVAFRARARKLWTLLPGVRPIPGRDHREMWALRHVSFEVPRGSVVGVVGRNGAGKSTLLKILSRITTPTEGSARIHGRVGSLLEVGTGFHNELTGRENIYLSGAILGMRRAEINRKFDEIVAFSEVDRYIDTPVKHYSSGMHLRLAFSVAAHLEPEILLVDEVLAVGDARFQKKCLGKMEDVASSGRTVLFVSHNLATVRELCRTGIVLEQGRLDFVGPVVDALAHYGRIAFGAHGAPDAGRSGWRGVRVHDRKPGFLAEAHLSLEAPCTGGRLFCILSDAMGSQVVHRRVETRALGVSKLGTGSYQVRAGFPDLWLAPGVYTLHFKFLHDAVHSANSRFESERIVVDVGGSADGNANAILAPAIDWCMEEV